MENKVILTYYDMDGNIAEETLWIDFLGDDRYQIKNIPFYTRNIAYNDIITVEEEDGNLYFDELIEPSEHSTVQIVFFNHDLIQQTIKDLEEFNCSWEGINEQEIIAVDVPSDVNYKSIKEYLDKRLGDDILDYREAAISETHQNNL